jgi:hypothetical protein
MKNILLIPTICFLLVACGGGGQSNTPKPTPSIHALTPAGISVRIEDGTTPDSELLEKLDADAQKLFDRAFAAGYPAGRGFRAMSVKIVRSEAPPCRDAIAFMVRQQVAVGTNYDGDPNYDKDDRPGYVAICVGGRYLEAEDTIVVTRAGVMTSEAAYFEWEHWYFRWHDPAKYYATMYHTPETGHPILNIE